MRPFAVWQSRPVFVTSTFRDMQAERDWLHAHVFPVLAERLRERFHHLEPIDLRWGVETVSTGEQRAKELLVLKVCLAEIKRSRPFLIALIGDRYGWRPPEERIHAAAREAGFTTDVRGKSVTALEIEYGILDSPEQRKLSRFYFRAPLPYDRMDAATAAAYSDLHSGEPDASGAHERLEGLKRRIRREMHGRVCDYQVEWDAAARRVTGLKAWGDQVLEDLWSDLENATREYAHAQPATWQQEEAYVLEQFLEEKSRNFVGREEVVGELRKFALSPAAPDAPWGKAITGGPGSGKSALFAYLARKLAKENVLLLAHAAGIGPRSGQLDIVLRRWIGELAIYLGEADLSEALTARDDLEQRFAQDLSRAARRVRVVCLLDAVNQWERTPAACHFTWLPELWPANARLIATAIPGSESEALAKRRGCEEKKLPVLNAAEAGSIVDTVCGRYHKTLHPEVRAALLARRLPDGSLSCGIPLWVQLAVEELLLLDADDFARSRQFAGGAERQLHALLLAVAGELPAGAEGLCGHVLERTEQLHGAAFARAFAELIALSRTGWRESDLQALIPAVTGAKWDPLGFAGVRRSFRAQLVQRGASGQWDFSHAQMWAAVETKIEPDARRRKHALMAAHLAGLPERDPLRQSERMFHLIGADDRARAAVYYGGSLSGLELAEATRTLAIHVAAQGETGARWVASLPESVGADGEVFLWHLCQRFLFGLQDALANVTGLAARILVADSARLGFEELRRSIRADVAHDLSVSYERLGDLHRGLGDLQRAREFYQKSLLVGEELRRRQPDSADYAQSLSVSFDRLGDLHRDLGDLSQALEFHQKSLSLREEVRRRAPDDADRAQSLSVSYDRLGDLHRELGNLPRALEFHQKSASLREELRRRAPDSADYAQSLSASYDRLGDLQLELGDHHQALEFYQNSLRLREQLRRNAPDDAGIAHALSVSYDRLGDLQGKLGDLQRAQESYQKSLLLREELQRRAPDSADTTHALSLCYDRLGDLHYKRGDRQRALEFYQNSLSLREELRRRAPDSAVYARALSVSYNNLGSLLFWLGDPPRALEFHHKSLSLREELRRRTPDSAVHASDLAVACYLLLNVYEEIHDEPQARQFANRFKSVIDEMRRSSMPVDATLDQEYKRLSLHNPVSTDAVTSTLRPQTPPASETLREVAEALESSNWSRCEELLRRPAKADKRLQNALAVVRLRQGRIPDAISILRRLLFPLDGIVMDTRAPEIYVVNFVIALALAGNEEALTSTLKHLAASEHPTVQALRAELTRRRASRPWWKRLAGAADRTPFSLDLPLGELYLGE